MVQQRTVLAIGLVSAAVALTTPPVYSTLQLPSQNATVSSTNATVTNLGEWPNTVFTKPLGWGVNVQVLFSIPYHPSIPTSESMILSIIEGMENAVRKRYPIYAQTVIVEHYIDKNGPVVFEMSSTNASITGPMIAQMLLSVWEMILQYGSPASVFAKLLLEGVDIGFFNLKLVGSIIQ